MSKPLKIFITYAHKDTSAKDELITHLAVLKREGLIDLWHDNEILPGDKWHDAIFSNLADSDILLYLTSAYSLASENCNKELSAALDADTKIRVLPIILDHCDWKKHQPDHAKVYNNRGAAYARKSEFSSAIVNFTKAIELDPDCADVYYNRGMAWLYLQEWGNFRSNLSDARDVGIDIAIGFRNVYGSVANFERVTGIQLPEDIAAMLTPSS